MVITCSSTRGLQTKDRSATPETAARADERSARTYEGEKKNSRGGSLTETDRPRLDDYRSRLYLRFGGGVRFFVACSNAYATFSSVGSLQADAVKATPNGCGFKSNPGGNDSACAG